jgi:hypothetical protein
MARKRQAPRDFHEPWTAMRSVSAGGGNPFPDGVPEGFDPEAASKMIDAACRAVENADWIIWGSNMAERGLSVGYLTGSINIGDGRRIIAVSRKLGLPEGSPDHEQIAKRIAECVNACAYIPSPEQFVADLRAVLLELLNGDADPRTDDRLLSLVARCIPQEEIERLHHAYAE